MYSLCDVKHMIKNQHSTWFEFHIFRDHPTRAGKLNVRGWEAAWVFCTSRFTAALPVGLRVFVLSCLWFEWLTSVGPDKMFPTYNYSCTSHRRGWSRESYEASIKSRRCVRFLLLGYSLRFSLRCRNAPQMQELSEIMYTIWNHEKQAFYMILVTGFTGSSSKKGKKTITNRV